MLAANLRTSDNPNSTKCPLSVPSLNSPLKTAVQIKELENCVAEIKQGENAVIGASHCHLISVKEELKKKKKDNTLSYEWKRKVMCLSEALKTVEEAFPKHWLGFRGSS